MKSGIYPLRSKWPHPCDVEFPAGAMFKISIIDTPCERKLLLEGKLIPPWTDELRRVWQGANQELDGRRLAIDLSEVIIIGPDGENALFDLMKAGAKFTCGGVLTKDVLKRLARRTQSRFRDVLLSVSEKTNRDGDGDATGDSR
jgi:hypothetical protein